MRLNALSEHSFQTVAIFQIDGLSTQFIKHCSHTRADRKGFMKSEMIF